MTSNHQPLTQRPAWSRVEGAPPGNRRRGTCASSSPRIRSAASARPWRRPASISITRRTAITDETLQPAGPTGRGVRPARTHRRDVPRRQDQRHREARGPARRPAGAERDVHRCGRQRMSCPRCTRCSTRWRSSPSACAAARGKGTPASASATWSTSASAVRDLGPVMAYEALRHYSERAMTFRFVSNVDGSDFVEADPRSRSRPRRCSSSRRRPSRRSRR